MRALIVLLVVLALCVVIEGKSRRYRRSSSDSSSESGSDSSSDSGSDSSSDSDSDSSSVTSSESDTDVPPTTFEPPSTDKIPLEAAEHEAAKIEKSD